MGALGQPRLFEPSSFLGPSISERQSFKKSKSGHTPDVCFAERIIILNESTGVNRAITKNHLCNETSGDRGLTKVGRSKVRPHYERKRVMHVEHAEKNTATTHLRDKQERDSLNELI